MMRTVYTDTDLKINGHMGFFSFFTHHPRQSIIPDAADEILDYAKSIVVRQDLIQNIIAAHASNQPQESDTHIRRCIQTYLSLENFIVNNEPLVVQKKYTKQSLRREIREKFSIANLPDQFHLIFVPESEQTALLLRSYSKTLMDYLANQIGQEELQSIIAPLMAEAALAVRLIPDDMTASARNQVLNDTDVGAVLRQFRTINTVLYQQIASSFGEKTVHELTSKHYQQMKELYDYDLISRYLQAIPPGMLDKERVTYMTRDDLEKQAMAAAEEKFHRELAEKSARSLQEEKAVIEQKVREQTGELTREKEALKEAIDQMNSNFIRAQKNEAKLLASVSGLSLGFILTDTTNTIVTINTAARAILTLPDTVAHIRDVENHSEDAFPFSTVIERCKTNSASKEFKEVDWKQRILRITVSPIFLSDPQKEYIGSVILIDDVTEEKRLERTKDEFFAIASHELRTPLTAIRGSIAILKTHYADQISEGDVPRLINYVDQSSNRLIEIINEFLNVSRLEQGRMVFHATTFAITDTIKSVIEELGNLAAQKNIYLRLDGGDQSFRPVTADKERVKQILVNLIGNALKFTASGGVSVQLEEADNRMRVKIIDTGIGISAANQKLLFRKFQQADENIFTHDSTKGTGLGLYISKRLIEYMNGTILLESSEENKGSTFTFTLPLAAPESH